jgi:hypothetical protein
MQTILKVIAITIVALIIIATGLNEIKGTPSTDLLAENAVAKSALDKPEEFIKCDTTLKFGKTIVYNVTLSYYSFDTTSDKKTAIQNVEKKYLDKVKSDCDPIVKKYKDNLDTYKRTIKEIAKVEMSLFDKLIGKDPTPPESVFAKYEPSYVSMMGGSIDSNMTFSRQDVADFYEAELGY